MKKTFSKLNVEPKKLKFDPKSQLAFLTFRFYLTQIIVNLVDNYVVNPDVFPFILWYVNQSFMIELIVPLILWYPLTLSQAIKLWRLKDRMYFFPLFDGRIIV